MKGKRIRIIKSHGIDRYDGEYELKISKVRRHYVSIALDLRDLITLRKRIDNVINTISSKIPTTRDFKEYYGFRKKLGEIEDTCKRLQRLVDHENN